MHRKPNLKPVVLGLSALLFSCAGLVTFPRDAAELKSNPAAFAVYIRESVAREMSRLGITGLSTAVVDGDETVFEAGFGWADAALKSPVTPDTVFSAGSVTKLVTATAVMKLVEDGRLDLDAPVTKYLPEFSIRLRGPDQTVPTIRGLLCHQSGLPSDLVKGFWTGPEQPADPAAGFMRLAGELEAETMAFPPFTVSCYSNIGYSLLGAVTARVSGGAFDAYVRDNVFAPLGMTASSFLIRADLKNRNANGYMNGAPTGIPRLRDLPAGGLTASLHDMAQFLRMAMNGGSLEGKTVLHKTTFARMLEPQNGRVALDGDFRIGLGWWLESLPGLECETIASHRGDLPPFHALLAFLPERRVGVVILVNSLNGGSWDLEPLAVGALAARLEMKTGRPLAEPSVTATLRDWTETEKASLPGYYAGQTGLCEIRCAGAGLELEMGGANYELNARADGTIGVKYKLLGFIPLGSVARRDFSLAPFVWRGTQCLSLTTRGGSFPLVKVAPGPVPAAWERATGTYRLVAPEPFDPYRQMRAELVHDARTDHFILRLGDKNRPLQCLNDNEAVIMGYGRDLGVTVRMDTTSDRPRIHYLGYVWEKQ
jgi:CubicO group peptidase (beta-lactamase class C family)